MRIGISAHSLSRRQTGVEVYLDRLLRHLPAQGGDDYHVFSNADPAPWRRPGLRFEPSALPTGSAATKVLWEQCWLPLLLRRRGIGCAHAPLFVVPWLSAARWIVTIHDLTFFRFPETCAGWRARYQRLMVPLSVRKAERIITDSEAVRRDLSEILGVPAAKTRVIPLGVDAEFFHHCSDREQEALCRRLGIERPFLLYVGTLEPRKNLPLLLRAFRGAVKGAQIPHSLVLAGRPGWGAAAVEAEIERRGLGERVVRLGYVAGDDLPALYSAADAVALPSLYEGFGLTALEALACETPVLCSDRAALPEVVGDSACLLDASDEAAWTEALVRTLGHGSADERHERATRGRAQALRFTWEETARQTRRVYEEVAA
jgi:glycosyltransferase involved in cell wall biosynthesis